MVQLIRMILFPCIHRCECCILAIDRWELQGWIGLPQFAVLIYEFSGASYAANTLKGREGSRASCQLFAGVRMPSSSERRRFPETLDLARQVE